jgi:hypothetical protein
MTKKEIKNKEVSLVPKESFSAVLSLVLTDPDYLKGAEPEGSNWDFSNWPGFDFRDQNGWVLREKFFRIFTMDGKYVSLRIIETDPEQFSINDFKIKYTISPAKTEGFPKIFISSNEMGNEKILRNSQEPIEYHSIPLVFQELANNLGVLISSNKVNEDVEASQWALFLKSVLQTKQIGPDHMLPRDEIAWDILELEPGSELTDSDLAVAERLIVEQELLGWAFADLVITV